MKQLHWIRVDCHTPDHPKVRRLERMVGDAALAYLVRLWARAATYSPNGDLSGYEVEEIEDWARWSGVPGELVDALVSCGFIDDGDATVQLHGWEERQAERSRVRAAGAERARRFRRKAATSAAPESVTQAPDRAIERNAEPVTAVTPLSVTPTNERTNERTNDLERARGGARGGAAAPAGEREPDLSAYLDALRRVHPRFGLEDLVARALYSRRHDLPGLEAFVATLEQHAASEEWQAGFAKTADKWIDGGGWKSPPPPPRRRGAAQDLGAPVRPVVPAAPVDVAGRIADLLSALPPDFPGREVVGSRIAALAHQGLDAEEVDRRLGVLQGELRAELLAGLDPASRAELEARMQRDIAVLRRRMTAEQVAVVMNGRREREMSRIYRLPEFTILVRPEPLDDEVAAS